MSLQVRKSPQALADLAGSAIYLWQHAGEAMSERFLQATEKAIADLAAMPGMGTAWDSGHTELVGVRRWGVPGFRKWIIFYREYLNELEVLRVHHSSRDLFSQDIIELH